MVNRSIIIPCFLIGLVFEPLVARADIQVGAAVKIITPEPLLPVSGGIGKPHPVKEKRGEVYINLGKALSSNLRVDGGVNYEYSNLKVRGDATADRTLKFLKPNITFDWKPGGGWHTQLSVKRTVAQLDFYDFISFGELSTNRVNGGNANLEPQRTWEFRATVEHPLLGDGLFKLDLGHDLVSMLQDRVLICDLDHPGDPSFCFDAPGNLGTGTRKFAALTIDAPLDAVGLKHFQLRSNASGSPQPVGRDRRASMATPRTNRVPMAPRKTAPLTQRRR